MTLAIPTHAISRKLSIAAFNPLPQGGNLLDDTLADQVGNSFSQTTRAFGGFWDAAMNIAGDRTIVEDWIANGLMRHIEVYDPGLQIMGEFFVNKITARLGRLTVTIGPVMNIVNRAYVTYNEIAPIVAGGGATQTITSYGKKTSLPADDATSQARYGIMEMLINGGSLLPAAADQRRDIFLNEFKDPQHRVTEGDQSQPVSVQIEMLGYVHLFAKYIYLQTTDMANTNASAKLQAIISADPNGIFSTGFSRITGNATALSAYETRYRNALEVIKEIVALGDDQLNRQLFGVYSGRRIEYGPAPTSVAYNKSVDNPDFYTATQIYEEPWKVRPGRWLEYTDFLIGEISSTDINQRRRSPRFPFLESVTFTMPNKISFQSGDAFSAGDILAKRFGLTKDFK